jgi:pentatricopeptide repeat protein
MPTSLPVPSKGALRTLRHLALGTSCTVAFSAGLLTEDRRRRIHAAREVHDNAKKLKSSRKYHSAGTIPIEIFEEQAILHQNDAYWLPSKVAASKSPIPLEEPNSQNGSNSHDTLRISSYSSNDVVWKSYQPVPVFQQMRSARIQLPTVSKQKVHNRQHRLAHDVQKLLDEEPLDLNAATSRLLSTLEQGFGEGGGPLLQCLIDTAAGLAAVCRKHSLVEESEKIFHAVFRFGPLTEDDYNRFEPNAIIYRLLESYEVKEPLDIVKLEKASSIFLAKFKDKPKAMSQERQSLGERLCRKTCQFGLHKLCVDIHFHLAKWNDCPKTTLYLLRAVHAQGHHKSMFRYFKRFFLNSKPTAAGFNTTVDLVIDSLLKIEDFERAEEVLLIATPMAIVAGAQLSITLFLQVLGQHWRKYHDIVQTQALFTRLAPLSRSTRRPQALYIAIIQCCVEAGQESTATSLFNEMRSQYNLSPKDLRVYGHFALAKAMRQDWLGVRGDLAKMKDLNPSDHDTFSTCFTPILKVYIESHSITESEDFVQLYVNEYQLKLNSFVMNLMTNAYGKANEVDALARWISFASNNGVAIDAVTFNTLVNNLITSWGFQFSHIFSLYQSVMSIEGASSICANKDTISVLTRLARRDCSEESVINARLKKIKSLKLPRHDSDMIYTRMGKLFGKGDYIGTVKLYKHARGSKVSLGPEHLLLAVKACMQMDSQSTNEATLMIQDAQREGLDVGRSISVIFVDRLRTIVDVGERATCGIVSLALNTVVLLEKANIVIPPSVLSYTTSVLQRSGKNRQAIEFWRTMSHRLNLSAAKLDIATITILCRAFAAILDHSGIRWAIETLRDNHITPDASFKLMLKEVQKQTVKSIESGTYSDNEVRRFLESIIDARQQVKEMRAEFLSGKQYAKQKTFQILAKAIEQQVGQTRPSKVVDGNISNLKLPDSGYLDYDSQGHLNLLSPQKRMSRAAAG